MTLEGLEEFLFGQVRPESGCVNEPSQLKCSRLQGAVLGLGWSLNQCT